MLLLLVVVTTGLCYDTASVFVSSRSDVPLPELAVLLSAGRVPVICLKNFSVLFF